MTSWINNPLEMGPAIQAVFHFDHPVIAGIDKLYL